MRGWRVVTFGVVAVLAGSSPAASGVIIPLGETTAEEPVAAPPPELVRTPPPLTRRTAARFEFVGTGTSYQCRLDARAYRRCSSPKVYEALRSGRHRFAVRAVYADAAVSEPAVHRWRVDAVAPQARMVRLRHPGDRTRLRAVWEHSDRHSGVAASDVRWRRTNRAGVFTSWRRPDRWRRIDGTRVTLSNVKGGRTYCFSVRAWDRAGNRSAWSDRRCIIARRKVRTTAEGYRYAAGTSPVFGAKGTLHTYSVEVQRGTGVGPNRFTNAVDKYLGASKGWPRGSTVRFQRVPPSRARIRVLLAKPATVDRHCSWIANTGGYYSCWSGRFAAINMNRWHYGADKFRGKLWQYRGYVLNHEVGHALGHRHRSCPGAGRPAPVMMQQSKGTGACKPNPWPYP